MRIRLQNVRTAHLASSLTKLIRFHVAPASLASLPMALTPRHSVQTAMPAHLPKMERYAWIVRRARQIQTAPRLHRATAVASEHFLRPPPHVSRVMPGHLPKQIVDRVRPAQQVSLPLKV